MLNDISKNLYKLSNIAAENLIGSMPSNEKLDSSNYNVWHLKVYFTLNNCAILDLLTTSMPSLPDKDEQAKDITASEQQKPNLKAYQA